MLSRTDRAAAFFLALFLFGVYLLSFNGRIISSDGLSMFAVTESFAKRGDVTTDQMWTFFATKSAAAPDGEVYSKYGYGTSLFALPFYLLALDVPFSGLMQVTLLSSAIAIALTAAFIFLALRRLNFLPPGAVCVALLFGLATPAWVYAKEFWSEPFAALTLFAAFYFLLCYRAGVKQRNMWLAGIWLGFAIAVRTTNLLLVPFYLVYAFAPQNFSWHGLKTATQKVAWRDVDAFLIPCALFSISVLLYNDVRFQNPLTTGYRPDETFSNNILLGAYGLLFSPGKGLFVYAPFLAALPFGIWQFYKRLRPELFLMVCLSSIYCILFSAWYYWWGGTNWAARFLVPTLPFLVLLCAPLIDLILPSGIGEQPQPGRLTLDGESSNLHLGTIRSRLALYVLRLFFFVLVVISCINELAGVAVNALAYRLRVLPLSANPDWDSIFQPALSPLIGSWQTLKPTNLDVAWLRATPDTVQVDWLVLALSLAFLLCCGWALVRTRKPIPNMFVGDGVAPLGGHLAFRKFPAKASSPTPHPKSDFSPGGKPGTRPLATTLLIAAVLLTFVSLARYADAPRAGGEPGYEALLQTLGRESKASDILILNDDAQARYFFNANRTALKWYGLSRDPARWDEMTQGVIAQKVQAAPRVWFAFDNRGGAPNPMREWFANRLQEQQRFELQDDVVLVLYTR